MIDIKIDDASFNTGFYLSEIENGLSEETFIEGRLKEGMFKQYADADRRTLLALAYDEIKRSGQPPLPI